MWRVGSGLLRTRVMSDHLQGAVRCLAATTTGAEGAGRPATKAVIFDMGGVLVPSPFPVFEAYEKSLDLPRGCIAKAVVLEGDQGAWARLERGEVGTEEFGKLFSAEASKHAGKPVDLTDMMPMFDRHRPDVQPFPELTDAIRHIRAGGYKTALLTNNWYDMKGETYIPVDKSLFDVVVESCKVKMNKPDPRIYQLTLDQLQVAPHEAIFLDDLGHNLKAAKKIGIRTIKVSGPSQAVSDLEKELGHPLQQQEVGGVMDVPDRLQIDIKKLKSYLNWALKLHAKEEPVVKCFEHGQSNPTYFVKYANKNLVLRKKPPGKLLPSAHAVEREYRVMTALRHQGVPVPKTLGLCEDSSLLGTPFYVMEHVPGRIFKDPMCPGLTPEERREIYSAMNDVLAKIHSVDLTAARLEDYGKHTSFVQRNFRTWLKQYELSKTGEIEPMNNLMTWLLERMPEKAELTLIHGDFRLDNLIFHPTRPEVVAVLDWELSTLGDPITDLATNCAGYYFPRLGGSILPGFSDQDLQSLGIPAVDAYTAEYARRRHMSAVPNWEFYMAFIFFRNTAILQGVYKRFTIGQASSPDAEFTGEIAKGLAELGWGIAQKSTIPPNPKPAPASATSPSGQSRSYSTSASSMSGQEVNGALTMSVSALSPRAQDIYKRVKSFISEHVQPFEAEYEMYADDPATKWKIHPKLGELKAKAKAEGLWNLFLPVESDPGCKLGAGLSNIEYAFLAEEMGKVVVASEVFNCSAPDTGNMEVLIRYGTDEQKEKWLKPMLNGEIRSCFAMTEPNVASSDATNIQSSITRQGNEYVINGQKWWTSGAMDPRCKLCIFMGKTNKDGPAHQQQSMVLVPMDAPGIKILRPLHVFGYDDAPHGHAEVVFEDVRVPVSNLLLGEGRGFEIAQGRLGPGRIHHCMRMIGCAERALSLMIDRVQNRVAFGKPLAAQGTIQQDIAKSRISIEQSRLLVLKAAHMMDTVGNKVAAPEIAMIKVEVPQMTCDIIDRAIQAHGGMGVCQDTPLARMYAWNRCLRLADGPDEVHMRSLAKMVFKKHNSAKL